VKNYLVINGMVNGSSTEKTCHCYIEIFEKTRTDVACQQEFSMEQPVLKHMATKWEVY
jgi:hypothetical protein